MVNVYLAAPWTDADAAGMTRLTIAADDIWSNELVRWSLATGLPRNVGR